MGYNRQMLLAAGSKSPPQSMYCQKRNSLGYIIVADKTGLAAVNLMQLPLKTAVWDNDDHWAIRGDRF